MQRMFDLVFHVERSRDDTTNRLKMLPLIPIVMVAYAALYLLA